MSVFDPIDKWGRTPIHWGILGGHRHVVVTFLDAGASVKPLRTHDEQGNEVETPLAMAERLAKCGAAAGRASVWGDIAVVLRKRGAK